MKHEKRRSRFCCFRRIVKFQAGYCLTAGLKAEFPGFVCVVDVYRIGCKGERSKQADYESSITLPNDGPVGVSASSFGVQDSMLQNFRVSLLGSRSDVGRVKRGSWLIV